MLYNVKSVAEYFAALPEERRLVLEKLRQVVINNLPPGFKETINGMITYVVPLATFPAGYHVTKGQPLPFMGLASQKHFVAIYHMAIYAEPALRDWFVGEYAARNLGKLDMGKSCIRLKKMSTIPYDLVGELCRKITPYEYVALYQKTLNAATKGPTKGTVPLAKPN